MRKIFGPLPIPEKFTHFPKQMAVRPSQIRASATEAGLLIPAAFVGSGAYAGLKLPVVILAGEKDRLIDTSRQSGQLHRETSGSRFRRIPGNGHMIHQTATKYLMSAIDEVAGGEGDRRLEADTIDVIRCGRRLKFHSGKRASRNGGVSTMSNEGTDGPGIAPEHDQPIRYLQRIRDYYVALGYGAPYQWAHFIDVPFAPLARPLAETRVALVTTAAPFQSEKGDQGPGALYNAGAKFYAVYSGDSSADHDVRISHIAYDRQHTTADDPGTWFPLPLLRRAAAAGRIGSLSPRFHGAPTNRSQKTTIEIDAPEILARCLADGVEAAVLVPNCPVCHQTVSLVARHLEKNGVATVIMGCAKDIVEYAGVPRLLFSDFPLGNGAGRPQNPESQAFTLELALRLLESAPAPRTTVQSPLRWSEDPDWKLDYSNVERLSAEEIARRRAEFDAAKSVAKQRRVEDGGHVPERGVGGSAGRGA